MDKNEPNAWEEAAEIVEAFTTGTDEAIDKLIAQIAQAVRDRATDS